MKTHEHPNKRRLMEQIEKESKGEAVRHGSVILSYKVSSKLYNMTRDPKQGGKKVKTIGQVVEELVIEALKARGEWE